MSSQAARILLFVVIFANYLPTVSPSMDADLLANRDFFDRLPRWNDYVSALDKRDVCTDAIPGTVSNTCTPGDTLCCVPSTSTGASNTFPQCQNIGGKGACCVANESCYIDTTSDCGATGAVKCTELAEGTSEACCPPGSTCPSNFNQTVEDTRCNLVFSSSTSSKSSTLTTSKTSTASSSTSSISTTSESATNTVGNTISTTSATPSASASVSTSPDIVATSSSSNSLSGGADAGIGIAAVAAVLAICGVGFWAYRRGKKKGEQEKARPPQQDPHLGNYTPGTSSGMMNPATNVADYYALNKNSEYVSPELPGDSIPIAEMDGNGRNELE